MKLLLTSSGITNKTIHNALVELMGKPVAEANALFVPTGVYPFQYGQRYAWNPIGGEAASRMCQLGWKSIGILEPSILPSIDKNNWLPALKEADALLVWGGDPIFINYWMKESGLTDLLPTLPNLVYVGTSAGSITTASTFAETYAADRSCAGIPLRSEEIVLSSVNGETSRTLLVANGMGFTEFAIIPHFENKDHFDASATNAEKWASRVPVPVYAIDEDTAIKVDGNTVEVVSEGQWKLFNPGKTTNR
ncbi:Type 1 glutamine amidotransferase-like domain-containing protein [Niabella soli]|uniref:Peptidase S51 n=1 Tax=Niabella soli DSM 19437 TaxID=929713 RepID=W0EY60_9BACT|nr:Type 1 glutamine amidotransferase-like domain-containing protein [Niabella soli]AHF15672.1 peptidase S51 [Niabella soli DSM 19437]